MLVLFQDAPLGGRIGSVGKHALVVQLRELVQLRYPGRLVVRGRRRVVRTDMKSGAVTGGGPPECQLAIAYV